MIYESSEWTWSVISKSKPNVIYEVTIGPECHCDAVVNHHCSRCGACSSQMSCSCPDSMNLGVACIHCHAVATFSAKASERIHSVRHHLAASTGPSSSCTSTESEVLDLLLVGDEQFANGMESEVELGDVENEIVAVGEQEEQPHVREVDLQDEVKEQYNRFIWGQGRTPKPKRINAYSTRGQLKAKRKKDMRTLERAEVCNQIDEVWQMKHKDVTICFICGRNDKPLRQESAIRWFTRSSTNICHAKAHTVCTQGADSPCSICNNGLWMEQPSPQSE
ncbi:hypothetical protein Aduo_008954 [Ancylostoma duodenale]